MKEKIKAMFTRKPSAAKFRWIKRVRTFTAASVEDLDRNVNNFLMLDNDSEIIAYTMIHVSHVMKDCGNAGWFYTVSICYRTKQEFINN